MIRYTKNTAINCFKQWSRRKISILVSLNRVIKIGVLCFAYSLVNKMPLLNAQNDSGSVGITSHEIEEVEITGRRSQVVSSELSRVITVIQRDEIEKAGIQSIIDLLEYVTNADIRQRGISGVQADAGIRGSSFDHVMVLVNGIILNDPQTGHFNLDIPVDYEAVERIEVLEGPAARALGPGAFMGAINIITKKGDDPEVGASQTIGKYNFSRSHLHAGIKTGSVNNFISASRTASDGYIHNTDFNVSNLFYRGNYRKDITEIDFQAAYQYKKFGAAGFYSPRFPDQYEETGTWFTSLKASTGEIFRITPKIYWRRKKDHFLLIRDNPAFYENYHLTDIYGSQLNITHSGKYLTSTAGIDLRSENILSNNIGLEFPEPIHVKGTDSAYYTKQYQRTNFAGFTEFIFAAGNLSVTAGAMLNWNTGFHHSPSFFPGLDISYTFRDKSTLFASINRALHLPTFTDLFYTDPVNQGNTDLQPNRMVSFEGGIKHTGKSIHYNLAGFYNSGSDIIDWLWSYTTNRFSPVNLDRYEAYGLTSDFTMSLEEFPMVYPWLSSVSIHYLWLNIDKSLPDAVSKYYNLRNKLSLHIGQQIMPNLAFSWNLSYQDRSGESVEYDLESASYFAVPYQAYWLVDGSLKWNIKFLQLYTEVSNILNTRFIDAGSALQPGRWFKAGVAVKFKTKS